MACSHCSEGPIDREINKCVRHWVHMYGFSWCDINRINADNEVGISRSGVSGYGVQDCDVCAVDECVGSRCAIVRCDGTGVDGVGVNGYCARARCADGVDGDVGDGIDGENGGRAGHRIARSGFQRDGSGVEGENGGGIGGFGWCAIGVGGSGGAVRRDASGCAHCRGTCAGCHVILRLGDGGLGQCANRL